MAHEKAEIRLWSVTWVSCNQGDMLFDLDVCSRGINEKDFLTHVALLPSRTHKKSQAPSTRTGNQNLGWYMQDLNRTCAALGKPTCRMFGRLRSKRIARCAYICCIWCLRKIACVIILKISRSVPLVASDCALATFIHLLSLTWYHMQIPSNPCLTPHNAYTPLSRLPPSAG